MYIMLLLIIVIDYSFLILYIMINILEIYDNCKRNYPHENLLLPVKYYCKYNPFKYSYNWNDSLNYFTLTSLILSKRYEDRLLFFTVIDDKSFKYLLNLYNVFLKPYNIFSLVTIVFYNITLEKCRKYKIFCVYYEWPTFLKNERNIELQKKLWFLKYYYFYSLINNGISIFFIDSDVLFINNCLNELVKRKEDIILLKSQLSPNVTFGNSGVVYK